MPPDNPRSAVPAAAAFAALQGQAFRFLALDVETANGFPGSICQIGVVGVSETGALVQAASLVDPEESFSPFNIRIHGIDAGQVAGAPMFHECLAALVPVLAGRTVFQHSNFDRSAFQAAAGKYGLALPEWDWRDSVQLARRAWPELKGNGGHGLGSLKTHLGLRFQHHDAGEDARAAAMVVLRAEADLGQDFAQILASRPTPRKAPARDLPGDPAGWLAGQVVVFAGDFALGQADLLRLAHRAGLTVAPRVTLKTNYVVLPAGQAAPVSGLPRGMAWRRLGELAPAGRTVRLLYEADFLDLVAPPEARGR